MGNLTFLGDIADWFDGATNRIIEIRDNALHRVDPHDLRRFHPPLALALAGQQLGVHLLQGFADTLRLGNGVREGTVMGVVQDVGRVMNVIGAGRVVGRVARAMSVVQTLPMECTLVSAFNALERTNNQLFVNVRDLATSSGLNYQHIGHVGSMAVDQASLWRRLGEMGVRMSSIATRSASHERRWQELLTWFSNSPRGAAVVHMSYSGGHHSMLMVREAGGIAMVDTNGQVFRAIESLRRLGYYPASEFEHVLIHDAAVAVASARSAAATARPAASNLVRISSLVLKAVPIVIARQLQTTTGEHERTGQTIQH